MLAGGIQQAAPEAVGVLDLNKSPAERSGAEDLSMTDNPPLVAGNRDQEGPEAETPQHPSTASVRICALTQL